MPQVRLGIITGWEGYERLVRDIGFNRAMQVVTTGERFDAAEAYRLGLINKIAEDADVVGAAMQFVESFDKAAPLALGRAKRVIHKAASGAATRPTASPPTPLSTCGSRKTTVRRKEPLPRSGSRCLKGK